MRELEAKWIPFELRWKIFDPEEEFEGRGARDKENFQDFAKALPLVYGISYERNIRNSNPNDNPIHSKPKKPPLIRCIDALLTEIQAAKRFACDLPNVNRQ